MNEKRKGFCNQTFFTLDKPITYQIQIAGQLSGIWSDWVDTMDCQYETHPPDFTVTILTGPFDQAALLGFLRRLYSLGFPLISVNYIQKE
jgi:hypothetical protein